MGVHQSYKQSDLKNNRGWTRTRSVSFAHCTQTFSLLIHKRHKHPSKAYIIKKSCRAGHSTIGSGKSKSWISCQNTTRVAANIQPMNYAANELVLVYLCLYDVFFLFLDYMEKALFVGSHR